MHPSRFVDISLLLAATLTAAGAGAQPTSPPTAPPPSAPPPPAPVATPGQPAFGQPAPGQPTPPPTQPPAPQPPGPPMGPPPGPMPGIYPPSPYGPPGGGGPPPFGRYPGPSQPWGEPSRPDVERPRPVAGTAPNGGPLDQRGFFGVDASAFTSTRGRDASLGFDVLTNIPVAARTTIDAWLPLGLTNDRIALGNPMLGAHHVLSVGRRSWLPVGGAVALPLATSQNGEVLGAAIPRALWNLHEVTPDALSLQARLAFETHGDLYELRIIAEPVVLFAVGRRSDSEFVFQQAFEAQLGHTIGGGMRLQGVAIPTEDDDAYQAALEPFFSVEAKAAMFRFGLMMPLDEQLGPPFSDRGAWGLHLTMGMRLDGPEAGPRRPRPDEDPPGQDR